MRSHEYRIHFIDGNVITVKSLDLSGDFDSIKIQLDNIAKEI